MEFCPKCGAIILVKEDKASCAKCGFRPKGKIKIEAFEKIKEAKSVAVISERELTTYPIIDIKCSKCKNKEAFFWTMQTRAADESETKFYKCTECDHTWRDYK